jgi:hypothetical protein
MFKIISKSNDSAKNQIDKEIAPLSARKIMEKTLESEKEKATDKWWRGRFDHQEAGKNVKAFKDNYDRTCPETLDPDVKNAMWKRAKQLKDDFVIGMPSKDELHPVKSFEVGGVIKTVVDDEKMRNINILGREQAWRNKNESKIREFKNIMRHLEPENPGASDIERFRPKGN